MLKSITFGLQSSLHSARLFRGVPAVCLSRTFLDAAYSCDEAWTSGIKCPELETVNIESFYQALDRSFRNNGHILPIDIDLFSLSTRSEQQLDDLQDLTHRFRRTPFTASVLPSTSHAIVRAFLRGPPQQLPRLLDMIDDRMNYGVFLDYYTANMLIDHFLQQNNYRDAAKMSSELMLQEDWQHPISQALALYSCVMYVENPIPEPWSNVQPEPDDGETVYVRVKYLRNEWNDDHFDLRSANQLVGKTLHWVSRDLLQLGDAEDAERESLCGRSCRLLGLALHGKWQLLASAVEELQASPGVTQDTWDRVEQLLAAAADTPAPDGDDDDDKDAAASHEQGLAAAAAARAGMTALPVLAEGLGLSALLRAVVTSRVQRHAAGDRQQLQQLYSSWGDRRQQELQLQRQAEDRQRRIQALDEKRQYLRERERLLYFFDNEEEIKADVDRVWNKPIKPKPAAVYKQLRRKRVVQEDYTPPPVSGVRSS